MSLDTTEEDILAVKKYIKAYERSVLGRLTTNAANSSLISNITLLVDEITVVSRQKSARLILDITSFD